MAAKLTRAKFAIRSQQAEKDFKTAEYYERTGHPGSAVFYYELVRRRYAATKYADIANERKEHLIAAMKDGRATAGQRPLRDDSGEVEGTHGQAAGRQRRGGRAVAERSEARAAAAGFRRRSRWAGRSSRVRSGHKGSDPERVPESRHEAESVATVLPRTRRRRPVRRARRLPGDDSEHLRLQTRRKRTLRREHLLGLRPGVQQPRVPDDAVSRNGSRHHPSGRSRDWTRDAVSRRVRSVSRGYRTAWEHRPDSEADS